MEKLNLTQKHAFTNQKNFTTTQNKHKKIKPGLLRQPAWKWRGPILVLALHKSVTYLLTYLLTAPGPYGANTWIKKHTMDKIYLTDVSYVTLGYLPPSVWKKTSEGGWHSFLLARCTSHYTANSIKTLKETRTTKPNQWPGCILSSSTIRRKTCCSLTTAPALRRQYYG